MVPRRPAATRLVRLRYPVERTARYKSYHNRAFVEPSRVVAAPNKPENHK